jgi:hypothetical protein
MMHTAEMNQDAASRMQSYYFPNPCELILSKKDDKNWG